MTDPDAPRAVLAIMHFYSIMIFCITSHLCLRYLYTLQYHIEKYSLECNIDEHGSFILETRYCNTLTTVTGARRSENNYKFRKCY